MRRILIINGPNLNLTGRREPEIYGTRTMDDIIAETRRAFDGRAEIEYFQSNCEGAIIDRLQAAGSGATPASGPPSTASPATPSSPPPDKKLRFPIKTTLKKLRFPWILRVVLLRFPSWRPQEGSVAG